MSQRISHAALAALVAGVTAAATAAPGAALEPPTGTVAGAPVSLTPEAAEALRRKVLAQCGLPAEQRSGLPWYFHFEFGQSLLEQGDARRAVAELSRAAQLKPEPQPEARVYGMWYEDYLPYLELAEAHASLGNWPCAADALRLSQAYGEQRIIGYDAATYSRLSDELGRRGEIKVESCRKEDFVDPRYERKRKGG